MVWVQPAMTSFSFTNTFHMAHPHPSHWHYSLFIVHCSLFIVHCSLLLTLSPRSRFCKTDQSILHISVFPYTSKHLDPLTDNIPCPLSISSAFIRKHICICHHAPCISTEATRHLLQGSPTSTFQQDHSNDAVSNEPFDGF
ncbi:hypothetical protein K504DRAFT_187114 [Pleomassaria siparia CBS 279.74]|uniref:Uncharacterized protein n=1 Tax=Pleomassaria siparia CBS 279.74 TaxID=1314801 RepID=A0A6G1JRX8_9PLEO|nr:hypothetical protein K504DRAFT_187114 [Pleomassaria siparia CBS 279.74]